MSRCSPPPFMHIDIYLFICKIKKFFKVPICLQFKVHALNYKVIKIWGHAALQKSSKYNQERDVVSS